jgi:hypothetical protein
MSVNLKVALLIVLICFASVATTLVLGISMKPAHDARLLSADFQGGTQLCNGTVVEPNGPIDCPGGPT